MQFFRLPVLFTVFVVLAAAEPGITNFHKVDDHLYRGAQPTADGWKTLAGLGVKTILDLRSRGPLEVNAEAQAVQAQGMRYVNVPLNGMGSPSSASMTKILRLLNSPDPVFVHCHYGRDRTGTVVAVYRMTHYSWPNVRALQEAEQNGLHWYEMAMRRYILRFRGVTTEEAAAELPTAGAPAVVPAAVE